VDVQAIAADLRRVLGDLPLELRSDATLGDRMPDKVRAYKSELMLEE
jgi:hypothetical protein